MTKRAKLDSAVRFYGDDVFSHDGDVLWCKVCDRVRALCYSVDGEHGRAILEKLDSVLAKNDALHTLREISAVLCREEGAKVTKGDNTPEQLSNYKHCLVVSADVERSFSRYKTVLRANRQSFTVEHLRQHVLIQCYSD